MSGIPHKNATAVRGSFADTSCITPMPNSQLINRYSTTHDPHCIDNIRSDVVRPEYWHRFTVVQEAGCKKHYSKLFILKLITDFVYPHELLPVHVSEKGNKLFFLARNCIDAIITLCQVDLTLPNPIEPDLPFTVVIIKDVLTINHIPAVNIEPNIIEVLKIREFRGLLDLSGFHEDEGLREFCPLFQPKVLLYVLSLTSKLEKDNMKITKIVLCNNDIRKLPSLESFTDRQFKAIDLGHNKIQNIEDVVPLKDLPRLQWIRLEGNPLCCRFDSGLTYFLYVKTICKKLQTLDSKRLCEDVFYKKHRTFLCDSKGYDFANQFVEQYYTYFDEQHRQSMMWFYHENALFSFTHRSVLKAYSQKHESLNAFIYRDRNLLLTGPRHDNYLLSGRRVIQEQFKRVIPSTRHHPQSFYIDLMHYTKTSAIICVTGVFKDNPQGDLIENLFCGFMRTFVLTSKDSKEWLITNDEWHIYTPYKFRSNLPPWPAIKNPSSFPQVDNNNLEHSDALIQTFENITGMAYENSKYFLGKNNWNLELALKVFIDEHINNEIPDEAFNNERDHEKEVEDDDSDDDVIITEDDILPSIATLLVSKPAKPRFAPIPLASNKKRGTHKNRNSGSSGPQTTQKSFQADAKNRGMGNQTNSGESAEVILVYNYRE